MNDDKFTWTTFFCITLFFGVFFAQVFTEKQDARTAEIYEIRDISDGFDSKIKGIKHDVARTESKVASETGYIDLCREKLEVKQRDLSYEAYMDFVRETGYRRTYDQYRALIELANRPAVRALEEAIADKDKAEQDLARYKEIERTQLPILEREREAYNTRYARQIDRDIEPQKNKYYYILAIFVVMTVWSFMALMKICPTFRYVVLFITGAAVVNHVTKNREK